MEIFFSKDFLFVIALFICFLIFIYQYYLHRLSHTNGTSTQKEHLTEILEEQKLTNLNSEMIFEEEEEEKQTNLSSKMIFQKPINLNSEMIFEEEEEEEEEQKLTNLNSEMIFEEEEEEEEKPTNLSSKMIFQYEQKPTNLNSEMIFQEKKKLQKLIDTTEKKMEALVQSQKDIERKNKYYQEFHRAFDLENKKQYSASEKINQIKNWKNNASSNAASKKALNVLRPNKIGLTKNNENMLKSVASILPQLFINYRYFKENDKLSDGKPVTKLDMNSLKKT